MSDTYTIEVTQILPTPPTPIAIEVSQVMGPSGPPGLKGDTGLQGAQGLKGDTGTTGAQGLKGDTGTTGAAGTNGTNGTNGHSPALTWSSDQIAIDGVVSGPHLTGPQGLKGDTGTTGAQGLKGDTGTTGAQGLKGDTGTTGAQGLKGDTGTTGAAGTNGTNGHSPALTWSSDQIAIDGVVSGPHLTGPQGPIGSNLKGTAILDFGAVPGSSTARATVSATGATSASYVSVWLQGNDSTADHNATEHQIIARYSVATLSDVGTDSITLAITSELRLTGTIKTRWLLHS